jgi:hypothetical protein
MCDTVTCPQFAVGSQLHTHDGFTLCQSAVWHTHCHTILRQYHRMGGLPDLRHPQAVAGPAVGPLHGDFAQGAARLHHHDRTWYLLVSPLNPHHAAGHGWLHPPATLVAHAVVPPGGSDEAAPPPQDLSLLLRQLVAADQLDQCWFDFDFGLDSGIGLASSSSSASASSSSASSIARPGGPAGHIPALYLRLNHPVQPRGSSELPVPRLGQESSDPTHEPAGTRTRFA